MALAGIIISELANYGITIDAAEGADITTVIGFLAGYFTPSMQAPLG